ncbi:orotidine-5'-phosphate decarboxylase [candidate division CSSED10-310 bacterium]|uniref:Orotidine 5'-phosphate decarboxylase n=1 Tax=candidate division CSSED10-310 bacterium TaxID=2855610 RepID=A0ABV6Z2S0_UNCC1
MESNNVISFADKLIAAIEQKGTPCIVGLDPRFKDLPAAITQQCLDEYGETLTGITHSILRFNQQVIDIVSPYVPAVKPQIAFYEMYGPPGVQAYLETITYARQKGLLVIADVKRNDIGSTVAAYSNAFLGRVPFWNNQLKPVFNVDAVTVNPYLGSDGIQPFLDDCQKYGKGIFVLVKTSNPSSSEFQHLPVEGEAFYLHVARKCKAWGENIMGNQGFSSVGLVVGATFPQEAIQIRKLLPQALFLVPGFGFQGGKAEDMKHFFINGRGAIINSSRGIIHAYRQEPYARKYGEEQYQQAIAESLQTMIRQVDQILQ